MDPSSLGLRPRDDLDPLHIHPREAISMHPSGLWSKIIIPSTNTYCNCFIHLIFLSRRIIPFHFHPSFSLECHWASSSLCNMILWSFVIRLLQNYCCTRKNNNRAARGTSSSFIRSFQKGILFTVACEFVFLLCGIRIGPSSQAFTYWKMPLIRAVPRMSNEWLKL